MNNFQIIANGISLDTYEQVPISLNYEIDDILDISKRNTSWSRTITLPGTPTNNLFFKQMFDVNVSTINYDPRKAVDVHLRTNDNLLLPGKLQLLNVLNNNGQIDYEISCAGNLKNLMTQFGEASLRNLNFSKYDHIRNKTNINNSGDFICQVNGTNVDLTGQGQGYYYPYIVNGASTQLTYHSYIYNLFPAFYINELMVECANYAGYSITSNFFQTTDYWRKLILPFTETMIQMDEETFNERKVIAGINDAGDYYDITPYRFESSGWWYNDISNGWKIGYPTAGFTRESGSVTDISGEITFTDELSQFSNDVFTCSITGRYNIDFNAQVYAEITRDDLNNVEYIDGQFQLRYYLEIVKTSGSQIINPNVDVGNPYGVVYFGLPTGSQATPWTTDTMQTILLTAENVLLEAGDIVRVRVGFNYPDIDWAGLSDNQIQVKLKLKKVYNSEFAKFQIVPASNQSLGNETISMNSIMPDIKMKDFFFGLVKMFNLIVVDNPNKPNDLIIEPRDDYFQSKQKVLDWSKKLDNDSIIKITPMSELDAKTYQFSYDEDDDYYNKLYRDTYQETYGNLSIDVVNDFSEQISDTKLLFASTPNSDSFILDRCAPFFCEKDDESFKVKKVKPRILFAGGKVESLGYTMFDYEGDPSPLVMSDYNYAGMWDHPRTPLYDLAFGSVEAKYWSKYTGAGSDLVPMLNLYNKFHKATLNNIISPDARLFEANFWLTPKDIAEFDFRDIVFCKQAYWRVQKINDYDPVGSDSITKVTMYKLLDLNIISKYNIQLPISNMSCPTDVVGVLGSGKGGNYYISLSGEQITEDCCNSLGGSYANGTCYVGAAKPTTGVPAEETGQVFRLPIDHTYTDDVYNKDQNSNNSAGVKTQGTGNYVERGAESTIVLGDNNTVNANVKSSIVIGSNIVVEESNTVYLGNIKIDQDGNVSTTGISVIRSGTDAVMEFEKTNFIDVIRSGTDVVRGIGGDSKQRPIIKSSN